MLSNNATQLADQLEIELGDSAWSGDTATQAAAELRRLSAEVEALRRDAERWRAVRLLARYECLAGFDGVSLGVLSWPHTGHATTPDYADAAIDASMKGASHD